MVSAGCLLTANHSACSMHCSFLGKSKHLLKSSSVLKITDFGLSRFLAEGQSIIVTKQIFGTRGSIAPELINTGEISFKSDIYGLGVIITKLLTGDNNYDFENWHKSLEVGSSQEKRCVEIARKCVEYDQHKRPTMDEIMQELNEMENSIQEKPSVIQRWRNNLSSSLKGHWRQRKGRN